MLKKLSVIIPVYNEEKTIIQVIQKVQKVQLEGITKEIIIVDDSSTDNTKKILNRINEKNIKIFYHQKNMGKGYSIRTGLKHTTGDIIIIQDADLEYDPDEYPRLIKPIQDKKTSVVFGSRLHQKNKPKYYFYYIGNLFLTYITNLLFHSKITDMETCYKVFSKEVIDNITLKSKRFDFEPEITAKILKKKFSIHEVQITYNCRDIKEGKKITWIDGIKAVYYLIKYRFID